jgi:hypothetical protein
MGGAHAGTCMLCGRTAGYTIAGIFYTRPGGHRLRREGRHLRRGDCSGGLLFELDVMPAWIAEIREKKVARPPMSRAYRGRAV